MCGRGYFDEPKGHRADQGALEQTRQGDVNWLAGATVYSGGAFRAPASVFR